MTDYGVGRIANAGVDVAEYAGSAAGTTLILAPELIGGGRANTFASYVYAFGLVLWCLFSARLHPWEDDNSQVPDLVSILGRVRDGDRPSLASLRPDTPPAVVALMQRCWAQDPAARPTALIIARETDAWLVDPDPRDTEIRELRARVAAAEAVAAESNRRATELDATVRELRTELNTPAAQAGARRQPRKLVSSLRGLTWNVFVVLNSPGALPLLSPLQLPGMRRVPGPWHRPSYALPSSTSCSRR